MNEENKNGSSEVVVVQNQTLADMTDDIIASASRRIANIEKIITLALKITNHQDWVDQQGKPYLTASGAEKIARLFGVSWKILKHEKVNSNDEKGTFYFYQTTGIFTLQKDSIEAVGTCSSKDQFFAKKKNSETGKAELKLISEIDETNIMKAAYSNCIANGITRLLGIRNLTWEQVKAGGVDQAKVAAVKYAEGGAGGGKISEPQGKRLWAITKTAGKTETELKEYLKKNYNIEHSREIDRKDYEAICKWAEIPAAKQQEEYVPQ